MTAPSLVWFREDLRIADNPALTAAAESGQPVLCVWVLDDESPEIRPLGGASRWWLHHSLARLGDSLGAIGGKLHLARGAARDVIARLVSASGARNVFWNRRYSAEREIDDAIQSALQATGVTVQTFNARLMFEPGSVTTLTGGMHRVFTPYFKASLKLGAIPAPLPAPEYLKAGRWPADANVAAVSLVEIRLLPRTPDWSGGLREAWTPGEGGALARLERFIETGLPGYALGRDRPDCDVTSRLSPHLRFGEISPRQILAAVSAAVDRSSKVITPDDLARLRAELAWRDFSHQVLSLHPDVATRNLSPNFDAMPWRDAPADLAAWQRGRTGYPLVDAGMRQLWATGFMHNRVRMVAGSFLVKHLLIDWREGERWFWDTLVDADPANNAASWQWVAGSGIDASPYYRVFNPIAQGERFDPDGAYVARWVPELARLPKGVIHRPWEAPKPVLVSAGITLGDTYPLPIIAHDDGRRRALEAFEHVKRRPG